MRIIPAIDIIDGKCVRLTKGDYNTAKIYSDDPIELAKSFEDVGVEYVHVVDLDGAKSKHIVNHKILSAICSKTKLKVDFGGGLKTDEDLRIAFDCGAHQVTGGSIAVKTPDVFKAWISQYGAEKIILGADCNNRKIATTGWQETSDINVVQFIKDYQKEGIFSVVCTDIDKDGMLQGPSLELYREILKETNIQLIASGGVSNITDLKKLKDLGCSGAIVGKAIYEGNITMKELTELC